jgi:subtilisin family serine protease
MDEREQNRQIVVATDHLRLVRAELGGHVGTTEDNDRLGLTLVALDDLPGLARALAERRAAEFPHATVRETGYDLNRVLAELRSLYEHRYAGWAPTLGKNRTLTGVQFKPYTHGFDEPLPVAAPSAADAPPAGPARRVRVGLFDTRLAPHAGLTGRFVADADALVAPPTAGRQRLWWEGHATFIAGLITREAPSAVLDVRTALQSGTAGAGSGDESWTMPLWAFAERLGEFRDADVAVLNLSLGVATDDGKPPLVLERAIAQLTSDMVVVAAAGNHGAPALTTQQRDEAHLPTKRGAALFPAALDNVLAVGALHGAQVAEINPTGAGDSGTAPWIDVFAPGVAVVSTYLGDGSGEKVAVPDDSGHRKAVDFTGWASWTGTSFAAGEVTGAVAARLAEGYSPAEAVRWVRERYAPR